MQTTGSSVCQSIGQAVKKGKAGAGEGGKIRPMNEK